MEIEYIGKCLLIKNVGEQKKERILVVGDLHLGYEESLNRSGLFITRKMFEEMISYFEKVFEKTGRVEKIVLLGDVKHEFSRTNRQEWEEVLKLFEYLNNRCDELIVVRGNHDNMLSGVARQRGIGIVEYYTLENITFVHGDKNFPEINSKEINLWLMGHLHPAVVLREGNKEEKYRCFLEGKFKGKNVIIVPSFFGYSEGSDPRESESKLAWDFNLDKFKVRVVGEGLEVLDFGLLKDIE